MVLCVYRSSHSTDSFRRWWSTAFKTKTDRVNNLKNVQTSVDKEVTITNKIVPPYIRGV